MQQSQKQIIAQQILSQHSYIKAGKTTLMYTPRLQINITTKACIVVSVSKKISPKAVARNYNKRVLRAILRENTKKKLLLAHNWMWICKDVTITKELRIELIEKIKSITK